MMISNPLPPQPHKLLLSFLFNNTFNTHCLKFFRINMSISPLHGSLPQKAIYARKLGHSNQPLTFKKARWALRFPLPPPAKDPSARRFSSTPAFRQRPRRNVALEGAIRVAAPFSYTSEASVYLTDSHFLKLPTSTPSWIDSPQCQSPSA